MANQSLRWRLMGGGFVLAGLFVFALLSVFSAEPELSPMVRRAPLVETQHIVFRQDVIEVRGQGFVRPQYRVELAARVSGGVTFVSPNLSPGGSFAKGELLLELDNRFYKATVDQTEGEIRATVAQIEFARKEVGRLSELAAKNSASVSALGQQRSQLGRLEGQLASLQGRLRQNQLNLEYTRILAPFDGQVFEEEVDVGNIVQPGQSIAQVFASATYEVIVSLDDDDAALIPNLWVLSEAQAADAQVIAQFGGDRYAWPAEAQGVEAAIDRQTRTVNLVVRVPNPTTSGKPLGASLTAAPPLLPGMYVEVVIEGREFPRIASIPRRALRPNGTIWVASEGNKLEVLPVEVIQASEDVVSISTREDSDEFEVIVSELLEAGPGMQVRTTALKPQPRDDRS